MVSFIALDTICTYVDIVSESDNSSDRKHLAIVGILRHQGLHNLLKVK